MFTRKDYLEGKCTHREYYAQFVTEEQKLAVREVFKAEIKDGFPVDTWGSINIWDRVGLYFETVNLLKKAGDGFTLAGAVCVNKEAARQIMGE